MSDAVLIAALARTNSTLVFDQILRRPDSSLALLAAMKDGTSHRRAARPRQRRAAAHASRTGRSRTQAAALLDSLSPAAESQGRRHRGAAAGGREARRRREGQGAVHRRLLDAATSWAIIGKSDAGPPLNGIGAHARAELLAHIVDPNREVDPSFWQWNVTTRKDETLVGVIARENAASLTLRSPAGDVEIKKDDITNRENTRRSLMPEGFEALGAEALRDILTFLAASQAPAAVAAADAQGPKEGGKGDAPLPEAKPIVWAAGKTKVLIIGGGSSHDFGRVLRRDGRRDARRPPDSA